MKALDTSRIGHAGRPAAAPWAAALLTLALTVAVTSARAAPGAHGPNGEHLDAPGAAVNASGLARFPDGSVNVPEPLVAWMGKRTIAPPQR